MPKPQTINLLEALLDSWDRNNSILVNLLNTLPQDALGLKPTPGSHSIACLFTHMHFVRLIFIEECAPEFTRPMPREEWLDERDPARIAAMLRESATGVREAVQNRLESGKQLNLHYDNPALFLQHMIWHEGYHHGQIKLALKVAGTPIPDEVAGPVTWDVWMEKTNQPN